MGGDFQLVLDYAKERSVDGAKLECLMASVLYQFGQVPFRTAKELEIRVKQRVEGEERVAKAEEEGKERLLEVGNAQKLMDAIVAY